MKSIIIVIRNTFQCWKLHFNESYKLDELNERCNFSKFNSISSRSSKIHCFDFIAIKDLLKISNCERMISYG